MDTLLANTSKADLIEYPWPHIVIKNPLSNEDCIKLIKAIPDSRNFSETKFTKRAVKPDGSLHSNRRLQHMMPDIIKSGGIWAEFVKLNTSDKFINEFMSIFGESIERLHPRLRPVSKLKHCQHRVKKGCDVGWTANIGLNTPVLKKASSVLGRHTDAPKKLYFGLFYLRHPDDDSSGGDLQVYDGNKCVNSVKYERNILIFGINSPNSIHAVSDRGPSKYPRLFANLYAEVDKPLFKPRLKPDLKY